MIMTALVTLADKIGKLVGTVHWYHMKYTKFLERIFG